MKLFQLSILALLLFSCTEENEIRIENQTFSNDSTEEILGNEDESITVHFENDSVQSKNLVSDSVYREFEFGGDFPTIVDIKVQYFDSLQFPYQDSVNKTVKNAIKIQTLSESTDYQIEDKNFLSLCGNHFIEKFKLDTKTYKERAYSPRHWEAQLAIFTNEKKSYVEISDISYGYTGGAHGYGSQVYFNICKTTGKKLILEDFFTDIKELTKIGEKYFRETHKENYTNITDWSEDFWFESNQFELLNNFSLRKDHIYFAINPYDINSYAFGSFDFEIPLEKVEHLLKKRFKN